ncbi:MAG: sensor domain-containing diguanylate cyclase [Pseudomonadales bacterium]|nr:sensor domain-containing diguanylate cyclase [Pseudomonadales bacterium]MBO6563775.1 sensor domain-containing diguanylate cyclase [Pseudomonadales bacterium]MBO6595584.1 sensor domain-containing diguanylate cyclase [Pseudomonadales bacterium]MBO6655653.1 sensor domain-containing diguanylate cyclase [Pseudomonadales bacterium]MBO6702084.1 sensor domain-containing diguanylate cyclase [Pseudomonadales bacterium]
MNGEAQTNAYLRLIKIGIALSAERDLDSLLENILLEAKGMANADAGTVYLATANHALQFSIVVNDTLGISQGGKRGDPINLPEIPLYLDNGDANLQNIASSAVHRSETIVIEDTHNSDEFDFSGTRKFDEMLGYRSTSLLTIPLKTITNKTLGVLQLLNAKDERGEIIPFSEDIVLLIEALASQASVAMENRSLIDEQEALKKQLEREVDTRTEELKEALTKLSEAHIILKELNTIDAVTGIRNRQYFDEVLDQEWRRARRQGYDISMLLLDIDHFKRVNDTYGHLAGDECLAAVAKAVDEMFNRPSDVVARYGGEEFAVILPYVSAANARNLAEQLRVAVEQSTYAADGNDLNVTISIGIATMTPDEENAPRDLIGWADQVLYEAKASGRNRVCLHGN